VACAVTTDDDGPDGEWVLLWRPVVHYGENRTACGERLNEDSRCVTEIKDVNCHECKRIVHAAV